MKQNINEIIDLYYSNHKEEFRNAQDEELLKEFFSICLKYNTGVHTKYTLKDYLNMVFVLDKETGDVDVVFKGEGVGKNQIVIVYDWLKDYQNKNNLEK